MRIGSAKTSRLTWLLLLLCLASGALLYWELVAADSKPAKVASAKPTSFAIPSSDVALEFFLPELSDLSETVDRPLFSSSRRPPAESEDLPQPVQQKASKPVTATLRGVIIADDNRSALLQRKKGGQLQWVAEGERMEGWQVIRIEPERVILRAARETDTLELEATRKLRLPTRTAPKPQSSQQPSGSAEASAASPAKDKAEN